LQWEEGLILACAKDIHEDRSRVMSDGMPQPPLLALAAHQAPHLIHLGCVHLPQDDVHWRRLKGAEQPFMHLLDGWRFFFLGWQT
jgi:hypothetical protein